MQLNITGHHTDITEGIRTHIEKRFQRLENYFEQITAINIILVVEKQRQKAEATVLLKGKKLFAEDEQSDMYLALDNLANKLQQQIIQHKKKTLTIQHRGANL